MRRPERRITNTIVVANEGRGSTFLHHRGAGDGSAISIYFDSSACATGGVIEQIRSLRAPAGRCRPRRRSDRELTSNAHCGGGRKDLPKPLGQLPRPERRRRERAE